MDNEKSQEILRLITEKKIAYQRAVALSAQALTEDERNSIRQVLSDYDPFKIEISPSYFYRKNTIIERNANKGTVRKELDDLRKKMIKFTPQELLEFRHKNVRESQNNFSGIYIIHNCVKDIYYVGQAERVLNRAYKHFLENGGSPGVYKDYLLGDKFSISLIPLENTSFSSPNELEDNAIRAYDSLIPYGYNRSPGNVMDKHIFKSDNYQKAAELILDKIKGTDMFSSLSNNDKRMEYTRTLLSELVLPSNTHFLLNFVKMIKAYQKVNKKVFRNDHTLL
ncbi:excinuclease ABC subunit C [Peribacillus simplex]|uniref:excinuclease ABC subunit C n=1 Tax=Peribacillus simplex TaxID=1478 RepID=UPI00381C9A28